MLSALTTLAQYTSNYSYEYSYDTTGTGGGVGFALLGVIFLLAILSYIFFGFCMYKIFKKAGRDDAWAAFVPIYNTYVLFEVAGRPGWWVFLGFIPFFGGIVLFIMSIIAMVDFAKSFGKGGGFAALLILLPIIGYPILAFGDAQYGGPAGPEGAKHNLPPQAPPTVPPATPPVVQ